MIESITETNSSTQEKVRNLFQWVFKNKFLSFLLVFALVKIFSYVFDTRPIKFERFKTAKELKAFLEKRHSIGSYSPKILEELILSKAKCRVIDQKKYYTKDFLEKSKSMYFCEYNTGWASYPPFIDYAITIYIDHDNNILQIYVGKHFIPL